MAIKMLVEVEEGTDIKSACHDSLILSRRLNSIPVKFTFNNIDVEAVFKGGNGSSGTGGTEYLVKSQVDDLVRKYLSDFENEKNMSLLNQE